MKLLNFNSEKPEVTSPEDDKAKPEKGKELEADKKKNKNDEEDENETSDYAFETDNPEDIVTGTDKLQPASERALKEDSLKSDATPWAKSPYQVEPGHGIALVDVLRRVASEVLLLVEAKKEGPAAASAEISWKQAFNIIKDTFKKNGIRLVEFKDREKHEAVPYYTRNTTDGIFFWINPRDHAEQALNEATKALVSNGMMAVRRESGILLHSARPSHEVFTAEEVASLCKGEHTETKEDKGNTWHTVNIKGKLFRYSYDPKCHKLSIYSSKGPIETCDTYTVPRANSKHIARVIRYQAKRYDRLFEPTTYGLTGVSAPFKLKKHIITYCGNGQSLVITPENEAYLMTDKGESLLCREEGKLGLNPDLTFKKVQKTTKFIYGDIWCKFGHILAKRGLLI